MVNNEYRTVIKLRVKYSVTQAERGRLSEDGASVKTDNFEPSRGRYRGGIDGDGRMLRQRTGREVEVHKALTTHVT